MDSREHVFDVVILIPDGDELPRVLHCEQGLVAKDEDAARFKAVAMAQKAGALNAERDLDVIEVLVTRPFKPDLPEYVYLPPLRGYYVPEDSDLPWLPILRLYPNCCAPTFTSGYLDVGGGNTSMPDGSMVKTGSTTDAG